MLAPVGSLFVDVTNKLASCKFDACVLYNISTVVVGSVFPCLCLGSVDVVQFASTSFANVHSAGELVIKKNSALYAGAFSLDYQAVITIASCTFVHCCTPPMPDSGNGGALLVCGDAVLALEAWACSLAMCCAPIGGGLMRGGAAVWRSTGARLQAVWQSLHGGAVHACCYSVVAVRRSVFVW